MDRSVARPLALAVIATLALATLVPTMPARAAGIADSQCAGPTAPADTVAPTTPGNFRVASRTKSSSITLGWVASYDAVGVAGYRLYRDGSWSGTLYQAGVDLIGTVMYDRLGGPLKTPVTYDLYVRFRRQRQWPGHTHGRTVGSRWAPISTVGDVALRGPVTPLRAPRGSARSRQSRRPRCPTWPGPRCRRGRRRALDMARPRRAHSQRGAPRTL